MAKYDKPVPTMGAEDSPDAIYDATTLGKPKMIVFGLQHMFAMFGATILVPVLTGLSVSATLLFAGLGTLLFHFLSKGKVPAFLGSSFAFIAGYAAIAPNGEAELLPYACLGVACAGLLYLVLSALFLDELACRRRCDRRHHRCEHLGPRDGEDYPDSARCARVLPARRCARRS